MPRSSVISQLTNCLNGYGYNSSIISREVGTSETGSDITTSNYDVVVYYTNGGSETGSTSLSVNLNNFVNSGGHLITGTFLWNSYPSGFDFKSYTFYSFKLSSGNRKWIINKCGKSST
jgi:hypothetical protein